MSPTVEKIGQMQIDGNITPHNWYQASKLQYEPKREGEKGRPNLVAITLLADILYWYRPVILRDEISGREIGRRQKFAADKLQKNYEKWGAGFGLTKRQVEDAMAFLKIAGLVTVETRSVVTEYGRFPNCAFIEPVVEAVHAITFPSPDKTGDTSRPNGRYVPLKGEASPAQRGGASRSNGKPLPLKGDDSKTPTKTSQKTTRKAAVPPGDSPSAVCGSESAWTQLGASEQQIYRERANTELAAMHSEEEWQKVKHKERLIETRAKNLHRIDSNS